jgi:hypothetical protein
MESRRENYGEKRGKREGKERENGVSHLPLNETVFPLLFRY